VPLARVAARPEKCDTDAICYVAFCHIDWYHFSQRYEINQK